MNQSFSNQNSILLGFEDNILKTSLMKASSSFSLLSRCIFINPNPFNLSSEIVLLSQFLSHRKVEKLLSTLQVVTGSVRKSFMHLLILGKNTEDSFRSSKQFISFAYGSLSFQISNHIDASLPIHVAEIE